MLLIYFLHYRSNSRKANGENPAVVTSWKNNIRKYFPYNKETVMGQKYQEKTISPKNKKKEETETKKVRLEDTSRHLWLINYGLPSPWSFPSRSGILLHAVVQSWLYLQRSSISPRNVPPLVPPSCAIPPCPAVVHWSALVPKAMRSSTRHVIHPFYCPPTQHKHPKQDPPPA